MLLLPPCLLISVASTIKAAESPLIAASEPTRPLSTIARWLIFIFLCTESYLIPSYVPLSSLISAEKPNESSRLPFFTF
ncbi:hypothetical protein X559_0947 [Paenilisteria newyorkensis]|nr:hypothetical protein X559_0947 [Listeria newyorkensis]